MMSYDDFLIGYENGSLGCNVSSFQTIRLFFLGKICERLISIHLLWWLFGFLLLVAGSGIEFLQLPMIEACSYTALALGLYILIFFYCFGDLILSIALANKNFFEFATRERILTIYSDDEPNLPKT
jgi:hypothetical protein